MQPLNKELVGIIAKHIAVSEPIYEFGALQVEGQEGFADLRRYFPGKSYVGCDMREGLGVDKTMNIQDIDMESNSIGTIICIDTLEHTEKFWLAANEFHRVLRAGGLLILTSVMNFKIHSYPYDYWRFTPDGFRSLTEKFETRFIFGVGKPKFPKVVAAVCFKGKLPFDIEKKLLIEIELWKKKWDDEILPQKSFFGKLKKSLFRMTGRPKKDS